MKSQGWLLIELQSRPALSILAGDEPVTLRLGDKDYAGTGRHCTFFYDWLRTSASEVVGIRFYPTKESASIAEVAQRLPYAVVTGVATPTDFSCEIEIYFGDHREYDPLLSADQCFGPAPIFSSSEGDCALAFELYGLDRRQLHSIMRLQSLTDTTVGENTHIVQT